MAIKRYRSAPKTAREPFEFEILGEHFRCLPFVTVAALHRLMTASKKVQSVNKDGQPTDAEMAEGGAESVDVLFNFIRKALVKEDRDRFFALLDDDEFDIELEEVLEIGGDMIEFYSGDRPTGEPSSVTSSNQSTGADSTGGSSPKAQTYSRSQPTEDSTS